MRAPRSCRMRACSALSSSSFCRRILPAETDRVFGSSPMIACAITLLPEPDSPTRHTISSFSTRNETSLTASARSPPLGSVTVRLRTSRTLIRRRKTGTDHVFPGARLSKNVVCPCFSGLSYALGHLGIQGVSQAITQDIHGEHCDGEEDAGKEYVVRVSHELHAPLGHDVAPGGDVGRQADAEEGQDRLEQDREGANVRALHEERGDGVRQDVAEHDPG